MAIAYATDLDRINAKIEFAERTCHGFGAMWMDAKERLKKLEHERNEALSAEANKQ